MSRCKMKSCKPVLKEATDLRQRGDDVGGRNEDDDASLAASGCSRGRLEPSNTDVALDGQADRQPD